jgi:hypothetical protein
LKVRIGDIALVIQEDLDLAVPFQAGDRINRNSLHISLLVSGAAPPAGFLGVQS